MLIPVCVRRTCAGLTQQCRLTGAQSANWHRDLNEAEVRMVPSHLHRTKETVALLLGSLLRIGCR